MVLPNLFRTVFSHSKQLQEERQRELEERLERLDRCVSIENIFRIFNEGDNEVRRSCLRRSEGFRDGIFKLYSLLDESTQSKTMRLMDYMQLGSLLGSDDGERTSTFSLDLLQSMSEKDAIGALMHTNEHTRTDILTTVSNEDRLLLTYP